MLGQGRCSSGPLFRSRGALTLWPTGVAGLVCYGRCLVRFLEALSLSKSFQPALLVLKQSVPSLLWLEAAPAGSLQGALYLCHEPGFERSVMAAPVCCCGFCVCLPLAWLCYVCAVLAAQLQTTGSRSRLALIQMSGLTHKSTCVIM